MHKEEVDEYRCAILWSRGLWQKSLLNDRKAFVKMDRAELLPTEIRVTFEDPVEMSRSLSAERMRVIQTVQKHHAAKPTISSLAVLLKRDRKAVSRDVKVLESCGLLKIREQLNPGHGDMKVVEPLAENHFSARA